MLAGIFKVTVEIYITDEQEIKSTDGKISWSGLCQTLASTCSFDRIMTVFCIAIVRNV